MLCLPITFNWWCTDKFSLISLPMNNICKSFLLIQHSGDLLCTVCLFYCSFCTFTLWGRGCESYCQNSCIYSVRKGNHLSFFWSLFYFLKIYFYFISFYMYGCVLPACVYMCITFVSGAHGRLKRLYGP